MAAGSESPEDAEQDPDDGPQIPCRIFLPVVPAARVIGKGGSSIKAIREQSGANVKILQKELPLEMRRREDRVAVIDGSATQVQQAIEMVLERVFDRSGLPDTVTGRGRDRAHIVEAIVPERSGSHIIGQRGDRIRSLIEETGCDVHVVKEPMVGLADQKRVRITGASCEDVANALWRLHEVLMEISAAGILKPEHFELRESSPGVGQGQGATPAAALRGPTGGREVPIRILVEQEEAAWVVGKRGNKITKLRDMAKVQMNDAESPPFDASQRVLEIAGAPLEQRLRVVQLVLEDLASRQERPAELKMLVPTEHFGSVMGYRGETIQRIMKQTGARIQQHKADRLDDGCDFRLRLVEIFGDDKQRLEVVRQIYNAIESRNARSDGTPGAQLAAAPTLLKTDMDLGLGLGLRAPAENTAAPVPGFLPGPSLPGLEVPKLGPDFSLGTGEMSSGLAGLFANGAGPGGVAEAARGAAGEGGAQMSLQLAMPSEEVARVLASESSGIAWRAGVKLAVARGAGGVPILQVVGTAVHNAVACYLVQDRLFMMH